MAEDNSKQYIEVRLGNDLYGIEIKYIDSIIVMHNITRVPKAQSYFLGVINLRGEVIPVMSLSRRLGVDENEFTSATRIIIIKPEPQSAPVGMIVDEVNEVITLDEADIQKMNYDENDSASAYSLGIGKLGDNLINILNIPEIAGKED
ncbi:MAG: chemotaxis protein CheW [Clostridiales bacterium]|jgi:purine-binding chemotaxis protein CheW|nr:chemotaxis protein CheW [Clostridiales bacterium]